VKKKRAIWTVREHDPADYDRLRLERDTAVQALTGLRRQLIALGRGAKPRRAKTC
jgi:hypothetical protein